MRKRLAHSQQALALYLRKADVPDILRTVRDNSDCDKKVIVDVLIRTMVAAKTSGKSRE